uniref:Uncharacterized protein n=1 Tax=Avena sativa TaxID=4498 RepID=A0ACD5YPA0_AVESA
MLPKNLRKLASSELQSVHDGVLTIERRLLSEKDPSHLVFVVKVPPGLGFIDNAPADLFFLRFDDIFNMFHLYPLHYTMVRLFSLSLAMQIIRENTPGIAIVDPYYMRDGCLGSPSERRIVASYLKRILVANKTKEYILVPYFPEDEHCTLISLSPKHSHATYFDSGSLEKKKKYDKIKEVLDDALTGFASTEGTTFVRTKVKFGRHVFNHVTEFPCVKQPENSKKEAYYALHHMRVFLLDQQNSTLPDHLKQWAEAKAKITDSDIRQEMYRIQQQFGAIIFRDVMTSGGSSTEEIS